MNLYFLRVKKKIEIFSEFKNISKDERWWEWILHLCLIFFFFKLTMHLKDLWFRIYIQGVMVYYIKRDSMWIYKICFIKWVLSDFLLKMCKNNEYLKKCFLFSFLHIQTFKKNGYTTLFSVHLGFFFLHYVSSKLCMFSRFQMRIWLHGWFSIAVDICISWIWGHLAVPLSYYSAAVNLSIQP